MPRGGGYPQSRLPFAPLEHAIRARGLRKPDHYTGAWQAVHRGRRDGNLPLTAIDAICVRILGVHPASIYGDAWWEAA